MSKDNNNMFMYIPVRLIRKGAITISVFLFFTVAYFGIDKLCKGNVNDRIRDEWITRERKMRFPADINEAKLADIRNRILKGDTTNIEKELKPYTDSKSNCRDKAQWLEVLNFLNGDKNKELKQKLQNLSVKDGPYSEDAQKIINAFIEKY